MSRWLKLSAKTALLRLFPLVLLASLADAALLYAIRILMQILEKTATWTLWQWLLATLLLVGLRWLFSFLRGVSVEKVSRRIEAVLSLWFTRRLRTLSPKFFHKPESEERLMVAYDSIQVVSASVESLMQTLQAMLQLLIFLPVLFYISPWLTLAILIIVLPVISYIQKKLHAMKPSVEVEMLKRGTLRSDIENAKRFFRLWSSTEELSQIVCSIFKNVRSVLNSGISVGRQKVVFSQGTETLSVATVVLILGFCGWMILNGNLDGESLILYCSALFLCYKPVKECARLLPQMRLAKSAETALVKLGQEPRKAKPQTHAYEILEFKNVNFSYSDDLQNAAVFRNMNLKLKTDHPILLQGPNGCGKSTFFKLVASLEEPITGAVVLPQILAANGIFSVSQDLILPPRKELEKKVALLKTGDVKTAFATFCETVDASKLVKKNGLSGGERAKVALLWALASPAKILLLDEPFAFIALEERAPILKAILTAAKSNNKWLLLATHEPIEGPLEREFELLDFTQISKTLNPEK